MIDVQLIKQLREKTGAGIADCRMALEETNSDLKKAESILKQKGFEKAAKKKDRAVASGLVFSYVHGNGRIGVLVEIACETDFVARTDEFQALCREVAMQVAAMEPKNVDALLKQEYIRDSAKTVGTLVQETIAKLGENIKIVRFSRLVLGE